MNAKEFLSQSFTLYALIKAKKSHIQNLREMQEGISGGKQTNTKVQTSLKTDVLSEFTSMIVDMEEETRQSINKLLSIQKEISEIIESISNVNVKLVLYERYVNLKIWEHIAEDNSYTVRWVYILHSRGLKSVDEILAFKNLEKDGTS